MRLFRLSLLVLAITAGAALGAGSNAPLADAAEAPDRDQALELLATADISERKVDVNARQVDGMTALHWATYHDDLDLATRLIEAGAEVSLANRYGVTALTLACQNGNGELVERLLEGGAAPNTVLPGGETALMTAARTGRMGPLRALLSKGADIHATDERRGQTALMWATVEGHNDVVKVLIELGADFKGALPSGFTPLLFAARQGHTELVSTLLAAGADVNEPVAEIARRRTPYRVGRGVATGATPLHLAVENGHWDLAAALLDAGADPNASAPAYTPLHLMAKVRKPGTGDNNPAPDGSGSMSSLDFVRDIAAHGADLDARMTEVRRLNNTSLNELGATPFMLAAMVADADLLRTLAELGADTTITTENNATALMAAAGLGTRSPGEDAGTSEEVVEALEVLLELGADVNAVNDRGETPMHGAAYKNLPAAVEFLAANGADIEVWNQPNYYGWTPLTIARGYRVGNFKPSAVTVAAVSAVMEAEGVRIPTLEEVNPKGYDVHAKRPELEPPEAFAAAIAERESRLDLLVPVADPPPAAATNQR
ncbi:MAG: ankyrin repeat domain-containing protein [Acidobacteriota bacterium]|nr:ankyrin repeat domain-containing protein [Acidobacteriota bacterium]